MSSELFDVSLVAQPGRAQQGIRALSVLARDRAALAGGIVLAAVVLCAVLAPVIAPDPPLKQDERNIFAGPSSAHLLGTDNFGRDIFSRLLYGGRTALVVGALSVLLALAVGTVLGVIAGYRGGKLDSLIMRGVDVLLAFPLIILAILIVVALGAGITNLIIAVAIVQIPLFTRLARSATLGVGAEEYLQAAVVTGAGGFWIVRQHVLPNILPLLFVQATTSLGIAILNAAALNFLGLGVQPPSPDWGRMVAEFSSYAFTKPELPMYPGLAIVITVLAANMLGDGLLKIVDPVGQKLSL